MISSTFEVYVLLMALVAKADTIVTSNERERVHRAISDGRVSPEAAERLTSILEAPASQSHGEEIRALLVNVPRDRLLPLLLDVVRDAYVMAAVDGEVTHAEVSVVDELLAMAGLETGKRAFLHEWGREAAQLQLDGLALLADDIPVE